MSLKIIELLHTPSGKIIYEVLCDDGVRYPHHGYFATKENAEKYVTERNEYYERKSRNEDR